MWDTDKTLPERAARAAPAASGAAPAELMSLPYARPRLAVAPSLPTRLAALFAVLVAAALIVTAAGVSPRRGEAASFAAAGAAAVFGVTALICCAVGRRRDRGRGGNLPDGRPTLATWALVSCLALGSAGVALGGGAMLMAATAPRTRCDDSRAACGRNLRQVVLAILMYANENKGRLPNTLDDVLNTQQVSAEVFVCPLQAPGPSGAAPYVYVGRGMKDDIGFEVVVLHDRPGDHPDGMNVAYGDGHVQWHDLKTARKILSELAAGHNPPRPEKLK